MHWLELKIPPLLAWLLAALAMPAIVRVLPALSFALPGSTAIALALVASGVAVTFAGARVFREQRTTMNPLKPGAASAVVSGGIYRVSRNPMYLGFLLALAGWAVYLSNLGAYLIVPVFAAWLTQFQIKPEERALLAKFGTAYAHYTARVRRWL